MTDVPDPHHPSAGAPTPDSINQMVLHEFPASGNACTEIGRDYAIARRVV